MTPFGILTGFAACAITSLALGLSALRVLRIDLTRAESVCLGYVSGSALASTLVFLLALAGLARKGVFFAVATLAVGLLIYHRPWFTRLKPASFAGIPIFFRIVFAGAWLVYGALYFRWALSPEWSPDGMAYHLGLVNLWIQAHRLIPIHDMYAAFPQGMEMLFLFAFSAGRHSAAALVHFSFLMLLPLLMLLYGLRFGFSGAGTVFAAIVVFTTPLIGWDGSVAYNDVALAAAAFTVVYFLNLWRREKSTGILIAAALAAGFATAIKYTGCFVILFMVAVVVWETRSDGRRWAREAIRPLIVASTVALAVFAPYLIRNWIWFRDPVAPFADSVFRNPWIHVNFEERYISAQAHLNGVQWRDLPLNLTIGGTKLPESFGPIYVLAPLALVGFFLPESRFLTIAMVFMALGYPENKSARFLIPAAPFLFLSIGAAAGRNAVARAILAIAIFLQVIVSWPDMVDRLHTPHVQLLSRTTWQAALRRVPEDIVLTQRLDIYQMNRRLEALVPKGEPVLAPMDGVLQSYVQRSVIDSYHSAPAERDVAMLYETASSTAESRRRWSVRFPAAPVRELRIEQHGESTAHWTINEIELASNGNLTAASAGVHTDAFPNPWDTPFMLDGNPATSWKTWEGMRPGMWIDLRFDAPHTLDGIVVTSQDGQWDSKMSLRVLSGDRWLTCSGVWSIDPAEDTRKDATRELKHEGIHYLLIDNRGWSPEKFTADPAAWGMREIFATEHEELYKMD